MRRTGHYPGLLAALIALAATAPAGAGEVGERIAQAEAVRQRAAQLGAEWLETGRLVEQARKAEAQGQLEKAAALADEAHQQALLAIQQAEREAGAWRDRVVR